MSLPTHYRQLISEAAIIRNEIVLAIYCFSSTSKPCHPHTRRRSSIKSEKKKKCQGENSPWHSNRCRRNETEVQKSRCGIRGSITWNNSCLGWCKNKRDEVGNTKRFAWSIFEIVVDSRELRNMRTWFWMWMKMQACVWRFSARKFKFASFMNEYETSKSLTL